MNNRDLNILTTEFKLDVEEVLHLCKLKAIDMVPFSTVRTPNEQAKLFRQSRSWKEISDTIEMLKSENANYLAEVMYRVGPQYGRFVTNAYPGLSWHQFGEAIDCFVLYKGQSIWDSFHPYYAKYAMIAQSIGLESGHYWKFSDSCHIQKRKGSPKDYFSLIEIDELMEHRYG